MYPLSAKSLCHPLCCQERELTNRLVKNDRAVGNNKQPKGNESILPEDLVE